MFGTSLNELQQTVIALMQKKEPSLLAVGKKQVEHILQVMEDQGQDMELNKGMDHIQTVIGTPNMNQAFTLFFQTLQVSS